MKPRLAIWGLLAASMLASRAAPAQTSAARTQVVFLGTGTPRADPERSGPARNRGERIGLDIYMMA